MVSFKTLKTNCMFHQFSIYYFKQVNLNKVFPNILYINILMTAQPTYVIGT